MTPAGTVTVVHVFTGLTTDGAYPSSGLVQAPTGTMYGTTTLGGTGRAGTIFSLTPAGVFNVVHSFAGGANGTSPAATPTLMPGGYLYGHTVYGGVSTGLGMGVIWRFKIPGLAFTDDPITPAVTTMKAIHVMELRSRIDNVRIARGLGAFSWGPVLTAGMTILAQHIIDLRTALSQAYTAGGGTPPGYTDPGLAPGFVIKAAHIKEIRDAVVAIE
jgi:uncharacterized repeat protein (TIGR03803 family)